MNFFVEKNIPEFFFGSLNRCEIYRRIHFCTLRVPRALWKELAQVLPVALSDVPTIIRTNPST